MFYSVVFFFFIVSVYSIIYYTHTHTHTHMLYNSFVVVVVID